jgi:hypothetical protein
MKQAKFFKKQADSAERTARSKSDVQEAEGLLNLAKAYRSQAEALKAEKARKKSKRPRHYP